MHQGKVASTDFRQPPGGELCRIPLPRTQVNKSIMKGRGVVPQPRVLVRYFS